jgi:hypothetical protein
VNHWARKLYFGASLLIGLQGGAHAVYVGGNPLSYVDPAGLDAVVVTGGRREATNPFGHTGIGVSGAGIYSYGNNTPLGSSPLGYLESQRLLRDQLVTIIPRTPEQDQAALDNLSRNGCRNCVWGCSTTARSGQIRHCVPAA